MIMNDIYRILKDVSPDSDFENSDDYIDDYLLDSIGILKLINRLEQDYKIKIQPNDVISRNFRSMDKIVALLESYGADV